MMMLRRDEHAEKAPLPMVVIELGRSIERRDEHSSKANSSMIVTDSGIVRVTREHPLNAERPIEIIEGGMVTELRVELRNASLPIDVKWSWITNGIPSCTPIRWTSSLLSTVMIDDWYTRDVLRLQTSMFSIKKLRRNLFLILDFQSSSFLTYLLSMHGYYFTPPIPRVPIDYPSGPSIRNPVIPTVIPTPHYIRKFGTLSKNSQSILTWLLQVHFDIS